MKTVKLSNEKIKIILKENVIYVPVKIFCEDYKINFNEVMIYFNSFNFEFDVHYLLLKGNSYLCFEIVNFIQFLFIISVMNKKINKLAMCMAYKLSKSNFKIINDINIISDELVNKYIRIPNENDKSVFMMVKDIHNLLDDELKNLISIELLGSYIKHAGFKRVGKRINNNSRYGYEVVLV